MRQNKNNKLNTKYKHLSFKERSIIELLKGKYVRSLIIDNGTEFTDLIDICGLIVKSVWLAK